MLCGCDGGVDFCGGGDGCEEVSGDLVVVVELIMMKIRRGGSGDSMVDVVKIGC